MKKLVATLAVLVTTGTGLAVAHKPLPEKKSAICFSKGKWSASDSDRPCVQIRLYEDGSFDHKVVQADGDRW